MSHVVETGYVSPERREPPVGAGGPQLLPDRRLFWQWVWSAVRPVLGWVLAALGAAALFAGWYGVSGEALTAKQLPYLVSGGLSGIALVVLAAAFLATEDFRRQIDRITDLEAKIDDLHRLFATELLQPTPVPMPTPVASSTAAATTALEPEPATGPQATPARSTAPELGVVALPGGASYHRPDCTLVRGKADARPADLATIEERSLRPCRVCDPPRLG
ncbi:MAG TPA: hypothetical protein VFT62_09555 [Mycobacteriales bacterium]|nr:hypothetical protein [Mycobacteriales bacterium]